MYNYYLLDHRKPEIRLVNVNFCSIKILPLLKLILSTFKVDVKWFSNQLQLYIYIHGFPQQKLIILNIDNNFNENCRL